MVLYWKEDLGHNFTAMSRKQIIIVSLASVLLSIAGTFALRGVLAQTACTADTACGSGLRCISGRCNVPPPIWNSTILGGVQSDAAFDVELNSRARGKLTVGIPTPTTRTYEGLVSNAVNGSLIVAGNIYTNALLSREIPGNVDDIWIGDDNDKLRVQGSLAVGPTTGTRAVDVAGIGAGDIRASGKIRGNFAASDGAECGSGQILKRNSGGSAWVCGDDAVGGGGGGVIPPGGSFDPCLVNVFRAFSTTNATGAAGGYLTANRDFCSASGTGAHICTAEEILHTINCSGRLPSGVTLPASGSGWVSGGPPGYIAAANDCQGWTSGDSGALGRTWRFDTLGGQGSQTPCNSSLRFTCCR
ncbi:MAG: hypothetical protein UX17_C0020G0002 [Parcubacteria group bacterium GW2011_GWC2_45_7]|nr:MAG: hypothetical protein UX17_C0020G0002 [Parcubacteria group bacterium GW2011_GWC2_45_7]KKU73183.1 MAG: hypothetical protein UX98_C0010G0025 [Parcubacteria group bacterium GW2011_GWA2_47_26]